MSSVHEDQSDDVGISGAVGVLVMCVSVCRGMSVVSVCCGVSVSMVWSCGVCQEMSDHEGLYHVIRWMCVNCTSVSVL